MKLKSFQIKNYKSIVGTGEVVLSGHDNITVLQDRMSQVKVLF